MKIAVLGDTGVNTTDNKIKEVNKRDALNDDKALKEVFKVTTNTGILTGVG